MKYLIYNKKTKKIICEDTARKNANAGKGNDMRVIIEYSDWIKTQRFVPNSGTPSKKQMIVKFKKSELEHLLKHLNQSGANQIGIDLKEE